MVILLALTVVADFIYTINKKYYFLFMMIFFQCSVFSQDSVLIIRKENIKEYKFPELLVDSFILKTMKTNYKNNEIEYVSIEPYNILAKVQSSLRTYPSMYPLCLFNDRDNWIRVSLNHVRDSDLNVFSDNFEPTLETKGPLKENGSFIIDTTEILSYSFNDTIIELWTLYNTEKIKCRAKLETYEFSREYAEFLNSVNFSHYLKLCVSDIEYYIVTYRWNYIKPRFKVLRNNHSILDASNQLILMKIYE